MTLDFTVERSAYNVLKKVFIDKAYSSIELDRALDLSPVSARGKITALVYGVLEKSVRLDYIVAKRAKNGVKPNIAVILKMGLYELFYGSEPDYAVVSRYVEFAKDRAYGSHGFINAVLRHAKEVEIPDDGDCDEAISLRYSVPKWAVAKFVASVGRTKTLSMLSASMPKATHIRKSEKLTDEDFLRKLENAYAGGIVQKSPYGYYVTREVLSKMNASEYTPQSVSSIIVARECVEGYDGNVQVLDVCSAPGGKSVAIKEFLPQAQVTSCDVHPHRVNLIKSYAKRMGVDLRVLTVDATEYREEFCEAFDVVLTDVPCTGSGLILTSPDVLLFKDEKDVASLSELGKKILTNSAKYVKHGGTLVYSTCSAFREEDEDVVNAFLKECDDFYAVDVSSQECEKSGDFARLFPDVSGADAFFIAKLRRK